MAISANSIIHYTDKFEKLQNILSDGGFQVNYSLEKVVTRGNKSFSLAIPMVSFCDIPISEYKKHFFKLKNKKTLGYYGDYGLGLTKKWAEKNGLNPVLYIESNSFVGTSLRHTVERIVKNHYQLPNSLVHFPCYTKNHQGPLERDGKIVDRAYRFYDEREWRYVPLQDQIKGPLFIPGKEYSVEKKYWNDRLRNTQLSFDLDDISYIIVDNDKEIEDLLSVLNDKYGATSKKDLPTILTSSQIIYDF